MCIQTTTIETETDTVIIDEGSANRAYLLSELQELQADLEDLDDDELLSCRESMLQRVNGCLEELHETDEDNQK